MEQTLKKDMNDNLYNDMHSAGEPRVWWSSLAAIYRFYADGFRSMTVGRTLWIMIAIKIALLFGVFRLLLFPDLLARDYDSDEARACAVRHEFINR